MKSLRLVTESLLWLIEFLIALGILLPLRILPRWLSLKAGEFLGLCMFILLGRRRRIALKNIEIAQKGGLRLSNTPIKTVCMHFINLGRSLSELSMLLLGKESIMKDITFENIEHLIEAKARGQGVIFITGHCGNWELLALAPSWKGITLSVVARPLNNPYLNKFVKRLRVRFGNKVIYKSGALKEILSLLRNGECVGILIDQSVAEDEAVITEFFGEKVYTTKMPALIAMKTGAVVVPAFINYLGKGKHRISVGEEIKLRITDSPEEDVVFNTSVFSGYIERYIKENPSEWLWIHRRWKLSHGRRY